MLVYSTSKPNMVLEARAVRVLLLLLRRAVPLNWRDTPHACYGVLPHILIFGVFNCAKNNSTTIKQINNESDNLIHSCDFVIDSNNWWNLL